MNPHISQPIRLRPIALPVEHGGWAMLVAPVLLGIWLLPTTAGFYLALATLGAFLTRQPLKIAFGDWVRGKRFPRTVWAERFALLYATSALLAFIAACFTAVAPFWQPLLLAAIPAATQLTYDLRKQSRTLSAELSGAIAISASAAVITMAGGYSLGLALIVWFLPALQACAAIVYIGVRLRLARNQPIGRLPAYLAHVAALAAVAGLAWLGVITWLPVAAFGLLLLRMIIGLLPRSLPTPTPLVGVMELGWSLLTVAAIALG